MHSLRVVSQFSGRCLPINELRCESRKAMDWKKLIELSESPAAASAPLSIGECKPEEGTTLKFELPWPLFGHSGIY